MHAAARIARPLQSAAILSLALFAVTLPVYFAVNLERNVAVVGVYSVGLFVMIVGLALYAGVITGRVRVLVSIYAYLVLLVALQFSVVGLFSVSQDVDREPVVALLSIKSLLAFGIGLALLLLKVLQIVSQAGIRAGRPLSAPFDKALWALLGYSLVSFVLSAAELEPRLAYLIHSIGTLAITGLMFRLYRVGEEELVEFGKLISALCGVLLVVGLLIYNHYEMVWLEYLKVKVAYAGMGGADFAGDLPSWFNTGFLIGDDHYIIPRFVSLVGNPVTLGYMFCFSYIISLLLGQPIIALIFVGATIFTTSKGAFLLLLVTTFFYFVRVRRSWMLYALDAVIISGAIGFTLVIESSANLHFQALVNVLLHHTSNLGVTSLLGYGLGTGGTLAAQAGYLEGSAELMGGESALGAMLYQLGFLGTSLYVAFFLLYRHRITCQLQAEDKDLYRLAQGCATGLLVNSIFQENLINLTLYLPYLFFLGAAANSAQGLARRDAVS